jgi:predicted dehydrogenase
MKHTNPTIPSVSRRKFLATGTMAAVAPMILPRSFAKGSPNDEITMGIIGCGGRGRANMSNFLGIKGVRVVAVCDVDAHNMRGSKAKVDKHYGNSDCKTYDHYTDLLQHPGLDAIVLATPDHWHARIAIDAMNAGMDAFGEKPFTWGLAEGRAVIDAIQKNKRIWQTGSWQRSVGNFRRFRALIQNDTLGKITRVECGTTRGRGIHHGMPAKKMKEMIGHPPEWFDWKQYVGPAKSLEFNPMIHPWNWRWLNATGGGALLDWVGHHVDIALWTLGLDHTGPVKVEGTGKTDKDTTWDLFDTLTDYSYQGTFANGRVVEVRGDFMGVKFTGENGWISVSRGGLKASNRDLLRNLPKDFQGKTPNHWQNFIECVRSRKDPVSEPEGAFRAVSFGQLAIAAIDTKRPLKWDPKAEKVLGDPEQAKNPRLGSRLDFASS